MINDSVSGVQALSCTGRPAWQFSGSFSDHTWNAATGFRAGYRTWLFPTAFAGKRVESQLLFCPAVPCQLYRIGRHARRKRGVVSVPHKKNILDTDFGRWILLNDLMWGSADDTLFVRIGTNFYLISTASIPASAIPVRESVCGVRVQAPANKPGQRLPLVVDSWLQSFIHSS